MGIGIKTALAAGVKSKVAVGVLTALLATGSAGGAVVAANAGAFGQQVKTQVETCKQDLAQGAHGIGECVSDFAQQHGAQQRQQHSHGNPPSNPGGTHGNSGSHGKSGSHGGPPSGSPGASHTPGTGKP